MKRRVEFVIPVGPYPATMRFHDVATDRQAHWREVDQGPAALYGLGLRELRPERYPIQQLQHRSCHYLPFPGGSDFGDTRRLPELCTTRPEAILRQNGLSENGGMGFRPRLPGLGWGVSETSDLEFNRLSQPASNSAARDGATNVRPVPF